MRHRDPKLREQECRGALAGPVRTPERDIRERGMGGRRLGKVFPKGGSYYIRSSLALLGSWRKADPRARSGKVPIGSH